MGVEMTANVSLLVAVLSFLVAGLSLVVAYREHRLVKAEMLSSRRNQAHAAIEQLDAKRHAFLLAIHVYQVEIEKGGLEGSRAQALGYELKDDLEQIDFKDLRSELKDSCTLEEIDTCLNRVNELMTYFSAVYEKIKFTTQLFAEFSDDANCA